MSVELHLVADIPQKALIVRDGKLLIVFDQRWELPGGRLHIDEAPRDGLRREVMEELGAEINVIGIHDTFTFFRGEMQHFCVVYHCELAPMSAEPCPDGVELKDLRWVSSVDELSGLSFSAGFRETVEKFLRQELMD